MTGVQTCARPIWKRRHETGDTAESSIGESFIEMEVEGGEIALDKHWEKAGEQRRMGTGEEASSNTGSSWRGRMGDRGAPRSAAEDRKSVG